MDRLKEKYDQETQNASSYGAVDQKEYTKMRQP